MDNTERMNHLIKQYKESNYTNCSPEDVAFMNEYIRTKIQEGDYSIIEKITKCDCPKHENFDLFNHYNCLYQNNGIFLHPYYTNQQIKHEYNIKNFYDSNQYIDNPNQIARIKNIYNNLCQSDKDLPNKALVDLSKKANIIFQISNSEHFDGECRLLNSDKSHSKPSFSISVTQKALECNDSALAVLLAHELSHAIDIIHRPTNYTGSIGWEAPEDFANIFGAQIAKNAGYDIKEFAKAQGTNNQKTQRAADVIHKYVDSQNIDSLNRVYMRLKQNKAPHDRATKTGINIQNPFSHYIKGR